MSICVYLSLTIYFYPFLVLEASRKPKKELIEWYHLSAKDNCHGHGGPFFKKKQKLNSIF